MTTYGLLGIAELTIEYRKCLSKGQNTDAKQIKNSRITIKYSRYILIICLKERVNILLVSSYREVDAHNV